jgi:hypothetical protein
MVSLSGLLLSVGCVEPEGVLRPDVVPSQTRGDLGRTFKSVDEAAIAGCAYIWDHEPKATRREFCGAIYRDREGIRAGLPEIGEEGYCRRPLDPPGTSPESGYHNHKQTPGFSWYDKKYASQLGRYLCAPGGLVKKLMPDGGEVIVR